MGVFRHKNGDISHIPGPDYPASEERLKAEREFRKEKLREKYAKFSREDILGLLEMNQSELKRRTDELHKWREWFSWAANETGANSQVAAGSIAGSRA